MSVFKPCFPGSIFQIIFISPFFPSASIFVIKIPFSIPQTTSLDPKDIEVIVPLGDIDADGRLIVVIAEAGGIVADTVFDNDTDPPYRLFSLFLNGVAGSVDQVNVTFCSPENGNNTLSCSGNGDSFIIGSIVVNAPCDQVACGPLPVELFDFNARESDQGIELKWASSVEINNSHYVIERSSSLDPVFRSIGKVVGKGSFNTPAEYLFNDLDITKNTDYYYRLKMVDLDQSIEYSDVISLHIQGEKDLNILRSNPVENELNLININAVKHIQIINIEGKILSERRLNQGIEQLDIDIQQFPKGMYFLKYEYENQMRIKRFVKK